jgi:hypothetical protein
MQKDPSHVTHSLAGYAPERRKDLRLRMLIDDLKAGIEQTRREVEMQSLHMDKLISEIEALKRARGIAGQPDRNDTDPTPDASPRIKGSPFS